MYMYMYILIPAVLGTGVWGLWEPVVSVVLDWAQVHVCVCVCMSNVYVYVCPALWEDTVL